MVNESLSLPGESQGAFGRTFVMVLCVHLLVAAVVWIGGRYLFKQREPEQITWLDGGGELGSAAPLPATESEAVTPPQAARETLPEVLPALPPDPIPTPEELPVIPMERKATPTPAPTPTPTPPPKPRSKETPAPTPRPKVVAQNPKPNRAAPTPAKKATPVVNVAKLATPRPGATPATPKITDSAAKPGGGGTGTGDAPAGAGNATNSGTKGGPGAAGGTNALLNGYFKKVEAQFHREWEQPLTVVRNGRDVEAHVRLRAAADGTVESLSLVKPTGNHEVDQSIEKALRRVTKVERPPAELLRNGILNELVAFILEL